ncbi:MAG: hypothetical protein E6Q62_09155 [Nitrosomonas sp.]|nr:MAG: hypothetical protein E6Q62_09155 [Nitrosomonas sp.]
MFDLKRLKWLIIILGLILNTGIEAHGRHSHSHLNFGIGIGGYYPGLYGPSYYGPSFYGFRSFGYSPFFYGPYYSYPPTVVVPVTPPVYIQREQLRPVESQINYWHYCRNPEGYYPYVKNCPGGWIPVAPQPSPQ